nr:Chain A, MSI-594 [synthetic construct]
GIGKFLKKAKKGIGAVLKVLTTGL